MLVPYEEIRTEYELEDEDEYDWGNDCEERADEHWSAAERGTLNAEH
jgi:hypothetical protein